LVLINEPNPKHIKLENCNDSVSRFKGIPVVSSLKQIVAVKIFLENYS
jgi:hypothetical protein